MKIIDNRKSSDGTFAQLTRGTVFEVDSKPNNLYMKLHEFNAIDIYNTVNLTNGFVFATQDDAVVHVVNAKIVIDETIESWNTRVGDDE